MTNEITEKTDNLTQTPGTANAAEAEQTQEKVAADLGKFKDVQALIDAYNNLQAEFTRRSQQLKLLQQQTTLPPPVQTASCAAEPAASPELTEEQLYQKAAQSTAVKDRIIGDYLKTVAQNKGAPYVTGGVMVAAPKTKPASIKQAGKLAAEFLKRQ